MLGKVTIFSEVPGHDGITEFAVPGHDGMKKFATKVSHARRLEGVGGETMVPGLLGQR